MELLQTLVVGVFFGGFFVMTILFLTSFVVLVVVGWVQEYLQEKAEARKSSSLKADTPKPS